MADLELINASNGSGEAAKAVVTAIRSSGSTTIQVDSVLNWPTKFIATAGKVLPNGTLDPTKTIVFRGHKDGSNIAIDGLAPGYTDVGNSAGDIVVIKPTTRWADELSAIIGVAHNNDGTLKSSVVTQVLDSGNTATNLRVKPRISVAASTSTLTPNIDNYNIYELNAQAAALTIANPTGTPNNGDVLIFRIKDNGTTRAITYGTAYVNVSGLDTLAATTAGKWHYLGVQYNAGATAWHVISITTGA